MLREEPASSQAMELLDVPVEMLPPVPLEMAGLWQVAFQEHFALDPHRLQVQEPDPTVRGEDQRPAIREVLRDPAEVLPLPPGIVGRISIRLGQLPNHSAAGEAMPPEQSVIVAIGQEFA